MGTGTSEAKVDGEAAGVEVATMTEGLGAGGRLSKDDDTPREADHETNDDAAGREDEVDEVDWRHSLRG